MEPTLDPDEWTVLLVDTRSPHSCSRELIRVMLQPRGIFCSRSDCWPRGSCFAKYICTSSAVQYLTALASAAGMTVWNSRTAQMSGSFVVSPLLRMFHLVRLNDFQKWCNCPFLDKIHHVICSWSASVNFLYWSNVSYTTLQKCILLISESMMILSVQDTFPFWKLLGNFSLQQCV